MNPFKLTLCVVLALLVTACGEPDQQVTSHLTVSSPTGTQQSWTVNCEYNEYSCNTNAITNARTMPMGDGVYYVCGLDGLLYMTKESYRAMTNLAPLQGMTCAFEVTVK